MYTQESEFLPGKLNPLNTRIITKCLNIDTVLEEIFIIQIVQMLPCNYPPD